MSDDKLYKIYWTMLFYGASSSSRMKHLDKLREVVK